MVQLRRFRSGAIGTAVILLGASTVLTAWFIVGSFTGFAPSVSATEIQNLYISRIVWFGAVIALLQIGAIVAILLDRKPCR